MLLKSCGTSLQSISPRPLKRGEMARQIITKIPIPVAKGLSSAAVTIAFMGRLPRRGAKLALAERAGSTEIAEMTPTTSARCPTGVICGQSDIAKVAFAHRCEMSQVLSAPKLMAEDIHDRSPSTGLSHPESTLRSGM